jgi:hypothetical protein
MIFLLNPLWQAGGLQLQLPTDDFEVNIAKAGVGVLVPGVDAFLQNLDQFSENCVSPEKK